MNAAIIVGAVTVVGIVVYLVVKPKSSAPAPTSGGAAAPSAGPNSGTKAV